MAGWPGPGEASPPPTIPVPSGRGGAQIIPRPLQALAGGPAPWADLPAGQRRPTLADVRVALTAAGPPSAAMRTAAAENVLAAAVLVALYERDGELFVLLTRRSWEMRRHSGEVSFPGGRRDPDDLDLWTTARREAHEEINLLPSSVEQIGELNHLDMVTGQSLIVPYVGALAGPPTTAANPNEVEAILSVAVSELLDPVIFREERWTFPWAANHPIYFFELVGDTVWGATADMLHQLLRLITGTGTGTGGPRPPA